MNFSIAWYYFKVISIIFTDNKLYLPVKTNLERDVRLWGEKREILRVFQWIINGIYIINYIGRTDHKCVVYVVLFHTFTAVCKGTKENNHEDWKQWLKRALAIDILVITCYLKIPSITLFSWCLKIKHERKIDSSFSQTDG